MPTGFVKLDGETYHFKVGKQYVQVNGGKIEPYVKLTARKSMIGITDETRLRDMREPVKKLIRAFLNNQLDDLPS